GYMAQKGLDALIEMLLTAVGSLYRAKADLAVIASNTPHVVFDRVKERSPIPLLSIVEEAGKKAVSQGYTKVGLIGTGFTMKESFYKDTFGRYGIEVCVPPEEGQAYIHDKIYNELEFGIVKDTTKTEFLRIIDEMIKRDHIQALILGCTELPLILKPEDTAIPLLNTVQIHVESILKEMTTRK
ncbi:MAG: amino acid racemase, partial [Clostridia bacterium]|nr:amino acid racemase [Clostridia bacterium]